MQPEGQDLEGRKINSECDNEMELSTPGIVFIYFTKQNRAFLHALLASSLQ